MSLNKSQKEAVENIYGPMLIIAGPGSGKTRTLVERMVYMIKDKHILPEEILVSTFTERAARELSTRITNRLSDSKFHLESVYIGTIHSICLKIIDENIEYSKLKRGYKVLENVDQKFFMFSKLKLFKEIEGFEKFFEKKSYFNNWKKSEALLKWFNRFTEEGVEGKSLTFLGKAYELYKSILLKENRLDFSMIQSEAYRILKENPKILERFQNKIKYIMIDEYQDTNSIQERLIFLIGSKSRNICVVGDDDQGIYRFRGATIKNILQFESKFDEGCKIVKLETNYRSEKDIVKFCKEWIDSLYWGEFRHSKELVVPEEKNSDRTRVVKMSVSNSEGKWQERIAEFLIFLKRSGKIQDFNQVAFLFRSVRNKKIVSLAHYLEYKGIGVYSPRSNLFFTRKEIMEVIGVFLYVLLREGNRVFNGDIKLDISDYYRDCLNQLEKKFRLNEEYKNSVEDLKKQYQKIDQKIGKLLELYYKILSLGEFQNTLENIKEGVLENRILYNLGILSKIIEKADILSKVSDLTEENIQKITDYFFTMHLKYLKDSGVDEYEDIKEFAPKGAVSFLTIHQSKGLEFPIVIVGSLDAAPDIEKDDEKDIEREFIAFDDFEPEYRIKDFDFWRLYYTAFSRAKNLLILTCVEISKGKYQVPSLPFKSIYERIPDILSGELDFKELEVDKINNIDLKESFSYTSHFLKYKECPFKYKLDKIYDFQRIKSPENFYGTLVHQSLEYINKKVIDKTPLSEEELEIDYYLGYEGLKKSEGIFLNKDILENGLKQVKEYFKNGVEVYSKAIEVEKELYVLRNEYLIEGKLDLIIECGEGLKIIDFKTGSSEIDDENLDNYINQIKLYCYLLKMNTTKKVIGGEIYFVKNRQKIEVPYEPGDEIDILNDFDTITKKIKKNEFSEKRLSPKKCLKCEFKNHCFGINML
ncbi:MAG: ATP-dependent DNA helicase [Cetobacterium sp.]|uniref:ATP-dependent DNA helicase n=1 Tax=Cetobacterium sp. TaxID=2071632 RepID=UPI002FC9488D